MSRKGTGAMMAALATVTGVIIVGLGAASISWFQDIDQNIRLNSVSVAEGRMESVIYAVDAFENAEVELNYRGKYNISREDGKNMIIYKVPSEDKSKRKSLESPVDFSISEGRSSEFCITKSKNNPIEVIPSEC